jgi:hypothetical protein
MKSIFLLTGRSLALPAAVLGLAGLVFGCASPNANPPTPHANTGYVDLYLATNAPLAWDVQRFDAGANSFKSVYSKLDTIPDGVLRLAFAPGQQRLRVTFLNRVIATPAEVEVTVEDGRVTPVQITLTEAGAASVQSRTMDQGATYRGHYGRRYKSETKDTQTYNVTAVAQPSKAYAPKSSSPAQP